MVNGIQNATLLFLTMNVRKFFRCSDQKQLPSKNIVVCFGKFDGKKQISCFECPTSDLRTWFYFHELYFRKKPREIYVKYENNIGDELVQLKHYTAMISEDTTFHLYTKPDCGALMMSISRDWIEVCVDGKKHLVFTKIPQYGKDCAHVFL